MSDDYKTDYSRDKNVNTLQKGSFNDWGDNSPARQSLVKQAPGEIFDVNVLTNVGDVIPKYNEISSVPVGAETLIINYTVPTAKSFALARVLVGGDNKAKFLVKVNGSVIATKRTWWTRFDENIPFDNLKLNADDILGVYVINNGLTAETFDPLF